MSMNIKKISAAFLGVAALSSTLSSCDKPPKTPELTTVALSNFSSCYDRAVHLRKINGVDAPLSSDQFTWTRVTVFDSMGGTSALSARPLSSLEIVTKYYNPNTQDGILEKTSDVVFTPGSEIPQVNRVESEEYNEAAMLQHSDYLSIVRRCAYNNSPA